VKGSVRAPRHDLSEENERDVGRAMSTDETDDIAAIDNIIIKGADIKTLVDGEWLNDQIINYYRLLVQRGSDESMSNPRVWIARTNFYSTLQTHGYKWVKRWSKSVKQGPGAAVRGLCANIFELDLIVVPINLGGAHWCCGAINFKKKRFEVYDSLGGGPTNFFRLMRNYLMSEWVNNVSHRESKLDLSGWTDFVDFHAPRQGNGYDCGVFTCQFMVHLSVGGGDDMLWDFSQDDGRSIRKQMVRDIIMSRNSLGISPSSVGGKRGSC
jgi:sentrin-specific protease 1